MKNKKRRKELRDATLCFLIEEVEGKTHRVCLAMKKRGFGEGRWNGVGGKVESLIDETIEKAAVRETHEEIKVKAKNLTKMAELTFIFSHNSDWNQLVHVYVTTEWEGEPKESEEMTPAWYKTDALPLENMWPDDEHWLPSVLSGQKVKAHFVFSEGDVIEDMEVIIVEELY